MKTMSIRRSVLTVTAAIMAMGLGTTTAVAAAPDGADGLDHYERDVYEIVGSTLRNPSEATDPSAPLFTISGVSLNRTWGEWSAATATSEVRVSGGRAPRTDVRLTLAGLVPNGVYSIFYGTIGPDSENPLCPGVERTLPLPSVDPAQSPDASSFVASSTGAASFRGKLSGNLLSATQVWFSVIYHFNGQTYGALPNGGEFETQGPECHASWGDDAMRQLLILQKW